MSSNDNSWYDVFVISHTIIYHLRVVRQGEEVEWFTAVIRRSIFIIHCCVWASLDAKNNSKITLMQLVIKLREHRFAKRK